MIIIIMIIIIIVISFDILFFTPIINAKTFVVCLLGWFSTKKPVLYWYHFRQNQN